MENKNKVSENEKEAGITLYSFAVLVKQMRHNQKRSMIFDKPEILKTLEPLEHEVDRIIAQLTDTQKNIFE